MTDTDFPIGTIVEIRPEYPAGGFTDVGVVIEPPPSVLTPGATWAGCCWVNDRTEDRLVTADRLLALAPLPTDPDELRHLLYAAGTSIDRNRLLTHLELQLGVDEAWRLFNPIDSEIRNGEQIEEARTRLRQATGDALRAVRRAIAAHRELAGGELYDVEIAENSKADLALGYLDVAERAIATYNAINPGGALNAPEAAPDA